MLVSESNQELVVGVKTFTKLINFSQFSPKNSFLVAKNTNLAGSKIIYIYSL